MAKYFEHIFDDGSKISVEDKKLPNGSKNVPTLVFNFIFKSRSRRLEVPLYDQSTDEYFIDDMIVGLEDSKPDEVEATFEDKEETEETKTYDKICAKCGKDFKATAPATKFCNDCSEIKISKE